VVIRSRWRLVVALVAALCAWYGARVFASKTLDARSTWPRVVDYANPDVSRYLLSPYPQLAADVTWARTLVYYASSMLGEADYRYLERYLDNIIELDPRFYRPYRWGAYSVSYRDGQPTMEEFELSLKYLHRGMENFPDRYEMFWIAGLRYYFDLHSDDPDQQRRYKEKGVALMESAMRKPDAPEDLASTVASMRLKLGQQQRALHDLREVILTTENEAAQKKLIAMYNVIAGEQFPDEAKQAKKEFERKWRGYMPFASPSMYVLLGDRPSPVIDLDALAEPPDLSSSLLDDDSGPNSAGGE